MPVIWSKHWDELLDFTFEFATDLASGETIDAASYAVTASAGLTITSATIISSTAVKAWFGSCQPGARYVTACDIWTSNTPSRHYVSRKALKIEL